MGQILWDGGGDGINWSSANNWNPNGIPGPADNVRLSGAISVTADGAAACNNLEVGWTNNTVTLTVTGTLTVNGNLTFDGNSQGANQTLNVNAGMLTVAGTVIDPNTMGTPTITITTGAAFFNNGVPWTWANRADLSITGTGTATFTSGITLNDNSNDFLLTGGGAFIFKNNGPVIHNAGTIGNNTTASTIYFRGGYTLNGGTFTTMAGENIYFGGNYTNTSPATTFNAASNAIFYQNTPAITPTTAVIFGNFQIINGITVTLAGNIEVRGDWTNNAGTLNGGANTVTFSTGLGKTIGGTSGTDFPNLIIGTAARDASYSLTGGYTFSCNNLTIEDGGGGANPVALTHNSTEILNVNGSAIIKQPAANQINTWNIAAGSATVTGNLSFTGPDNNNLRIAKLQVGSGSFTLNGNLNWTTVANAVADETEVIELTSGTINFMSPVSMPQYSGTINISSSGTINFYGVSASPSFAITGGTLGTDVQFNTVSGCTLRIARGITNAALNALTVANGSRSIFVNSGFASTVTPTSAITFGNIKISGGATVVLAGNISLTNDWTNSGGTFTPGTNTVTFSGAAATQNINGPETFYILTANQITSTIKLNSDVTITNTLNMTGHLFNLNGFNLILGNSAGAALNRTAGICYGGTFRRWFPAGAITPNSGSYYGLFPIGTATEYRKVEITSTTNPTVADYVDAWHTDALSVTDVTYTDNEGAAIQRITDMKTTLLPGGALDGVYQLDITFTGLSASGATTDLKLITNTGGTPGSAGCQTSCGLSTGGTVGNPIVKRKNLNAADFNNDWVVGTINKDPVLGSPLRQYYYSRKNSVWSDITPGAGTWSFVSGGSGASCDCTPVSDAYAVISGNQTVTLDVNATVDFVDIQGGGTLLDNGVNNITVNKDLYTVGSGKISPTTVWSVGRDVIMRGTGNSTIGNNFNVTGKLDIGGSVTFTQNSGTLTVSGDVVIDGTVAIGANSATLNGSGTNFSGAGSFTGSGTVTITNNKTILAGTSITTYPQLFISSGATVTNNGTVTHKGDITGADATSTWVNVLVLKITGALLATGTLKASAAEGANTVNYNGSGAQTIKTPFSSYYNLTCSNKGAKSMSGASFTVSNLVTVQDTAVLDETAAGCAGVDCDLTGGAGLTMTGWAKLIVVDGANLTFPGLTGSYSLTGGTVILNHTGGNPVVRGVTYNKLILDGSRAFNTSSLTNVTDSLTYSSTGNTTLGNNVTVGTFIIESGTLNASTRTITVNGGPAGTGGWSNNGGTFTATTSTVVFNSSSAQPIGGTQATTFYNLTINNGSVTGVTLSKPVTVGNGTGGTLALTNGYLYTDATNVLTMAAGSSVNPVGGSATSFVDGPVAKTGTTDFIFPTGDDFGNDGEAIGNNVWARIAVSGLSASETFTATYFFDQSPNAVPPQTLTAPLNDVSIHEYWTLNRAGANNAKVTLYWENAGRSYIDDCPDLTVARWNGASWVEETGTASGTCSGSGAGSVITNAAVTSFSPFTFGSKSTAVNPLPIELLSFTAALYGDVVGLAWITSSETNNDYFTVEKSSDAITFEDLTYVKGSGTSSLRHDYNTNDDNPFIGVNYYRLKQTDFDGKFTYSDIVAVKYEKANQEDASFNIYPNPVKAGNEIQIKFTGYAKEKEILVVLLNTLGQTVYSKIIITGDNGTAVTAIDPYHRLASGVYIVTGSSDDKIYSRRLVVK